MMRAALVSVVLVVGVAATAATQGVLRGSWEAVVCVDGTPQFTGLDSTLQVAYEVAGWTFAVLSGMSELGWVTASFDASALLGPLLGRVTAVLHPQTASFAYLESFAAVALAGVSAEALLRMESDGAGARLGVVADAPGCGLEATAYFNLSVAGAVQSPDCSFRFSGLWIDVECGIGCFEPARAVLGLGPGGFEGLTFAVSDVVLGGVEWLALDLAVSFDDGAQGKMLSLTPRIHLVDDLCLSLYARLLRTGNIVDGIEFFGARLHYAWGSSYITSLTAFDPTDPFALVADPYWEMLSIGSTMSNCCDGVLRFEACTFFDATSDRLFDWGMTQIDATVGVGGGIDVSGGLTLSALGLEQIYLGLGIHW